MNKDIREVPLDAMTYEVDGTCKLQVLNKSFVHRAFVPNWFFRVPNYV